jgi:hypothetical protein
MRATLPIFLVLVASGCIHAQQPTNLPTPVVILPLPDHSAAGKLIFDDPSSTTHIILQQQIANRLTFDAPLGSNGGAAYTFNDSNSGAGALTVTINGAPSGFALNVNGRQQINDASANTGLTITETGTGPGMVINSNSTSQPALVLSPTGVGEAALWSQGDISPFSDNTYNNGVTGAFWKNVLSYSLTAKSLAGGQCVQTGAGGVLTVTGSACASSGAGVTSLNSLTGGLNIVGTTNQLTVSPGGSSITLSIPAFLAITQIVSSASGTSCAYSAASGQLCAKGNGDFTANNLQIGGTNVINSSLDIVNVNNVTATFSIAAPIGSFTSMGATALSIGAAGSFVVNGNSGVTGSTCTHWTYGVCDHL